MYRLNCIILVIAVLLLAIVKAASASLESTLATSDCYGSGCTLSNSSIDAPDKKLLRSATEDNKSDEERAMTIPGLSKLKGWLNSLASTVKNQWKTRLWMWQKQTPGDLFKVLELDKGVDNLLANPKMKTWILFVTAYNKKYPKRRFSVNIKLTDSYGEADVMKMLLAARQNPETNQLASKLYNKQLTKWERTKRTENDIFETLGVNKVLVDDLISNPAFITWQKYYRYLNDEDSNAKVNLIKKLATVFDDNELAKAIEATTKLETTEPQPKGTVSVAKFATSFQEAQFKKWIDDGFIPTTILEKTKSVDRNQDIYRKFKVFFLGQA